MVAPVVHDAPPPPSDALEDMTKFDACAKGVDRRGIAIVDDVLASTATERVPADGFVVTRGGKLTTTDDDEGERDDAERVRRASKATTSAVFFDIESDGRATAVVIAYGRRERDATANAARALDWFEDARALEERPISGKSYEGGAVRVIEGGKVLSIDAPIAFEPTKKKKLTTRVGGAARRDAWLDQGAVRVFLGDRSAESEYTIPERAIYLGVVSERSFSALIEEISRSMDLFVSSSSSSSSSARVKLSGALLDECGCTEECVLLDLNRKRILAARATLEVRNESAESTKRRLDDEHQATGARVREAVLRGTASKKAKALTTNAKWDSLIADDASDVSSEEDG